MQQPVILKFQAKRDASIDTAFKAVKTGVDGMESAFDKAVSKSEDLDQVLKRISLYPKAFGEMGTGAQKLDTTLTDLFRTMEKGSSTTDSLSKAVDRLTKDSGSAGRNLADVGVSAEQMWAKVSGAATTVAVGFAAVSATLVGLAGAVIKVNSDFEVLIAKLATVQGSTERALETFKFAQGFAVKTPFDVEDVVEATVQLEVYGQRSREILPRVAALAAGMGKSLSETSLAVGKALSGSLEGFESLRNTYGITTRELVKFGAKANETGGVLIKTAADAEKAEQALVKIIDLRFGDAIERQAATLQGQLSNVADEAKNLAAEVGKGAAEVLKFGAAFVGGGLELLRKLPSEVKELAGASLTVAAGLSAAAVAAGAAAVAMGTFGFAVLTLSRGLTAAGGLQGALFIAEQSMMRIGLTAVPGMAASFLRLAGPIGLAVGAFGALYIATQRSIDQAKEQQAQIKEETRLFQQRIQQYKDLRDAVIELERAQAASEGREYVDPRGLETAADRMNRLKNVLDNASASDFFSAFKKAGLDVEAVKKQVADLGNEIQSRTDKTKELNALLAESKQEDAFQNARSGSLGGATNFKSERTAQLEQELALEHQRLHNLREQEAQAKLVRDRYDEVGQSVEKIGQATQRSQDYAKYADQAGDLKSLNDAYDTLTDNISEAAAELQKLNLPTSRDGLLNELRKGIPDEEIRQSVLAYLDLLEDQEKREKAIRKERIKGDQDRLKELQSNLDDQKAAREVSAQEELGLLQQQYEVAKRLGEDGENELTQIKRRQATLRRKIAQDEVNDQKDAAKAALDAAKTLPTATKASERGTQSAVDSYDEAVKRVKAWQTANASLIKQFPELGRQGQAAIQQLEMGKAQAEVARTTKNFSLLRDEIRDLEADAATTSEKLAAVARAKDLTKAAQAKGNITGVQASETTEDLERKERDLNKTKLQEDIAFQQRKLEIARQGAEQELAIAESLADGSIRSSDKILVARERLHQFQIQAIELEKSAAIAGGEERVRAEEAAAAKIKAIEQQKTADLHAELKKRYDAEKNRLQGVIDENQTEDALKFGTLDFGGDSTADQKRRTRKQAEKELEAVERAEKFRILNPEAVARAAEEDRQRALRNADPSGVLKQGQAAIDSASQAAGPQTVNNNTTNTVNIYNEKAKTKTARSEDEVLRIVKDEIATNQYYDPDGGVA